MSRQKKIRICVACCPGGHFVQATQLAPIYEQYDHFYFMYSGGVADKIKEHARVRTIPDVLRYNPWSWFVGLTLSLYIACIEKPDVVITTGAGAVVFFCIFAKMFGAKLIFIESMANVKKPTLTSKMLYPFADLFIVQWPALLSFFPRGKYYGRLF